MTITPFTENTPGVYHGLPAEQYHKAIGVSHSMLKNMNPPARLPVYLSEKWEPSPAMLIGTHVHGMVLEPDKPLPGLAVAPDGTSFATKEGKAWKAAQDPALMILKHDEYQSILGCVKSIAASELCQQIFKEGDCEVSCFDFNWRVKMRFMQKCRIDFVPPGDTLVDIKTVQNEGGTPEEFSKTLYDMSYYTQAAYYLDLWNRLNERDQKQFFTFVVVEKKPPYLVSFFHVDEASLDIGRKENEKNLSNFMSCSVNKNWWGYPDEVQKIGIPDWAKKRLMERQQKEWENDVRHGQP